ncbi:MAG: hypothetical protein AAEJ65_04895 [Planctomycetota bacterium]
MSQKTNPFEKFWPQLKELYCQQGLEKLIAHIHQSEDRPERRALFLMASQRISNGQGLSRSLDDVIGICRAAIDEFSCQAAAENDPEERSRRLDGANILSYNLAADLAPCWPEDTEPRTSEHFEEGIRCAQDCLDWREILEKGALPFHLAWWAMGAHLCGLGDWNGACEAFEKSLEAARIDAQENSTPDDVGPESSFVINISIGWLEFARWRSGDQSSYDRFLEVISAFRSRIEQDDEGKDEAITGIGQLETAALRMPGS